MSDDHEDSSRDARYRCKSSDRVPRGWYGRGYLPHLDGASLSQAVTFRLVDSLPQGGVARWKRELKQLSPDGVTAKLCRRIEACLDSGLGACHLRDKRIANVVQNALLFFDGKRYDLHAWVIMPNHTHALFTPVAGEQLERIVHSWKSYTSKAANRVLRRHGPFWQREFYDRYIRDEAQFLRTVHYIEENPVVAGLCQKREEWEFSSAHERFAARWSR